LGPLLLQQSKLICTLNHSTPRPSG